MLKRGHRVVSHHVRNIAECALAFSVKLRDEEEFPSEEAIRGALGQLARKPVIAVAGDKGCGKSSVFDLLGGLPFFSKPETPALARIWAHSVADAGNFHEGVEVRYHPADFLNEVVLMDTRGIDDMETPVHLAKVLGTADIIVFVIDGRNPVGKGSWQFLAELPEDFRSRMVIAITHEDFFNYEEQQLVKNSVRELSEQYFGVDLPLYMLRAGGEFKGQGAEALARRINSMLEALLTYSGVEERLLEITRVLLSEQKHVLHNQDMLSRLDAGFLSNMENEIDYMQRQIENVLPARLQAIARFVQDCIPMMSKKASRQLGYFLSIKHLARLERMSFYMDAWFYEYIRKGVEEQHEYHNREFIAACQQHWNNVRPRVKDQMDCEIGPFPEDAVRERLDMYRRRLGRSVYAPLTDFGFKACLTKLYAGQKNWMYRQLVFMLLLVIAAGCLGGLGENMMGLVLLGSAVAFWVLSSLVLWLVRARMTAQIAEAAEDMNMAFQIGLKIPLYEATISGVADYRKLYTNIRGYVAVSANQVAPLMAEHNKLFYLLSALTRHS